MANQTRTRPDAIVCDLDQTLVDTRTLKLFRSNRRWSEAYARIPTCTLVAGAREFLSNCSGIPIAVVTNSPSKYAERVLAHFEIRFDVLVAFHDVRCRKPDPEPTLLALQKLGIPASNTWCIGDQPEDIISAKAAGVSTTIGILAASDTATELLASTPSVVVANWTEVALLLSRSTGR